MTVNKVFVHATYECNAFCKHCAVPRRSGFLSDEDFLHLVYASQKNGVEFIVFGGGEPLLHPGLERFVVESSQLGLLTKVETNGLKVTPEFLDRMAPHLYQLNVSLDGADALTHNSLRQVDVFESAVKTISEARNRGIDVAVWSVVMKANEHQSQDIVDLVRSCGADKVSFLYTTPVGRAFIHQESLLVDPKAYGDRMAVLVESNPDMQIRFAPYGPYQGTLGCLIKDSSLVHVDPDGQVYSCVLLLDQPSGLLCHVSDDTFVDVLKGSVVGHSLHRGCLGLAQFAGVGYDPRGPDCSCPCRTVSKDWSAD